MAPDLVGRRLLAAIRDGDFYDAAERWAAAEGLIPERG